MIIENKKIQDEVFENEDLVCRKPDREILWHGNLSYPGGYDFQQAMKRAFAGQYTELKDDDVLLSTLRDTAADVTNKYYWLGYCLSLVRQRGSHRAWGYQKFNEFVNAEMGFKERKARHLMEIWRWVEEVVSKQSPEIQKRVAELPWTKNRVLATVSDESNLENWLEEAEKTPQDVLTMKAQVARRQQIEATNNTPVFLRFQVFPEQQENIEAALELAARLTDSESRGYLLDVICLTYQAENIFQTDITPDKMVRHYLGKIGLMLGLDIVAFDSKSGRVVSGIDDLDKWKYKHEESIG